VPFALLQLFILDFKSYFPCVNSRKTTAVRLTKVVKIQVVWIVTPCRWVLYPDVSNDHAVFIFR